MCRVYPAREPPLPYRRFCAIALRRYGRCTAAPSNPAPRVRAAPGVVRSACILVAVRIDLHTHTYPASSCAVTTFEDYIARCRDLGLEAIALTNHGNIDDNRRLEKPLAD